jgi:hypothetical protein
MPLKRTSREVVYFKREPEGDEGLCEKAQLSHQQRAPGGSAFGVGGCCRDAGRETGFAGRRASPQGLNAVRLGRVAVPKGRVRDAQVLLSAAWKVVMQIGG